MNLGVSRANFNTLIDLECKNHQASLERLPDGITKEALLLAFKCSFLATSSAKEAEEYQANGGEDRSLEVEIAKKYFLSPTSSTSLARGLQDIIEKISSTENASFNANVEEILSLLPLSQRTELLLSFGGDDRLTLEMNKLKLNKYFSTTIPRPEVLRRGSCTCSTITLDDYVRVDKLRQEALLAVHSKAKSTSQAVSDINNDIIDRLKRVLSLHDSSHDIVLFPSGSDAEFFPLLVALIRSARLSRKLAAPFKAPKVYNYVTAAGEVGSGTPNAAWGKHFSPISPRGNSQRNNGNLVGIEDGWITLLQFKPRGGDGSVQFREDEIVADVRTRFAADDAEGSVRSVAVIHAVLGSKTGLIYPSAGTLQSLVAEFGERVVVTMDACQLRCRLGRIREFTDAGYLSLVTGSKFFAGPPFRSVSPPVSSLVPPLVPVSPPQHQHTRLEQVTQSSMHVYLHLVNSCELHFVSPAMSIAHMVSLSRL